MKRWVKILAALLTLAQPTFADPEIWRLSWPRTEFDKTSVAYDEIKFAGPAKDGIPAVLTPQFIAVRDETGIPDNEPVMTLELDGHTPRAYPIRYLIVHEIVNDHIGETPVAVTFCPLCNSGVTFDRRVDGKVLTFGVSGMLRHNDMVMYDHQTESWWQQAVGEAILGTFNGTELTSVPGWMESWSDYKSRNPDGLVLAPPAGQGRYGSNPYWGYDSATIPFGYWGDLPDHIPALARVVRVDDRAWPMTRIATLGELAEDGVRITWHSGQASALDKPLISQSKDVGSIRVYDAETGENLPHDVMFAFAFNAFWPDGQWMLSD